MQGSWCLQRHERKHRQQNVYYAAHDDEQLLERLMLDDVPIEPPHRLIRDDDWRPRRNQQQHGASQGGEQAGAAHVDEPALPPTQPPSPGIASHGEQRINDSRLPNGREHTSSTPPAEGGDAQNHEQHQQSGLAIDHEEQQQQWSQQLPPPPPPPLPAPSVQQFTDGDLAASPQEELDAAEQQALPLAAQAETQQQTPMEATLDDASTPQQAPAVQAHAEEQQQEQEGPEIKPHDAVISGNGSAAQSTQAAEAGDAANLAGMDVVAAALDGTTYTAAAVTSAAAAVPSSANTDSTAAPDAAGHAAVGPATEAYAALQHLLAPLQAQLTGSTQWAVESCRYSAHVAQRLDAHGAALLSHSGDLTELRRSIEKAVTASVQRDVHAAFNAYMTPMHAEVRALRGEVAELRTLLANTAQSTQAAIRDGVAAGVKAAASLQATDAAASATSDADVHAKQQHRLARAKEFAARLSPLSSQSQQQQATIIKQGDDDEFAMALEDASPALLRALSSPAVLSAGASPNAPTSARHASQRQCSTAADGHATVYAAVAAISGHHSQSPLTPHLLRMRTRSHLRRMALLPALHLLSNLTPLSDWLLQQSQWTQWQPWDAPQLHPWARARQRRLETELQQQAGLPVLDRYRLHKIFTLPDRPALLLAVAPALDLESLRRQVAAGKMHTAQEFMQWGEALLRVAGGHTVGLSEDGAAVCDAAAQLMRMFFQWLCLELLPMPCGGVERDAEEKAETMHQGCADDFVNGVFSRDTPLRGPSTARMPSWRAALILRQQCADGAKQLRLLRSQRHKHRVLREALSAATEIESPAARGYARIVATLHAKAMAILGLPHSVAQCRQRRRRALDATAVSQRRELEVLIAGRYTFQILEDVGVQLIVQQAKEASTAEQAARQTSPSPSPPPAAAAAAAAAARPASVSPRALAVSTAPPPSAATQVSATDVDTAQLSAAPAPPRRAAQQPSAGAARRRAAAPPSQPPTAAAPANVDASGAQQKVTPSRRLATAEGRRDDRSPGHGAPMPAATAQRRGSSSLPTAALKDPRRSRTPSPKVPVAASTDLKFGDRAPSPTALAAAAAAAAAAAEAESISDASTALERQSPPVEAAAAADDVSSVTPARGDAPTGGSSCSNMVSTHGGSGGGGDSGSWGIGLPPVYPRSASAADAGDGDDGMTKVETSSGRALTVHSPVPNRSPSPQLQGDTLPSRLWSLQSLLEGDALIVGAFLNIDFDKYLTYLDEVESPQDLRSASCCLRERLKPGGTAAEQHFAAVKYLLLLMEIVRNSRTFTGFTEGDSPSRAAVRMEDLVRGTYTKQLAAFLSDAHRATLHSAGFPALESPLLPADADAEAETSPMKHKRGRSLDSKNKASTAPGAALNGAAPPPPPADADKEEPPAKRKRGSATGTTTNGTKANGNAAVAATVAAAARRSGEGGPKRPRDASEEDSGDYAGGGGRSAPHGSSKVARVEGRGGDVVTSAGNGGAS
ncbi:hypothetical protein JKP88DRAFT_276232 [Tribonema minus]|uniref:Uncharacterized protein n=1 Tax=Tribonema minus TaxID=303371 RepID=A0A836CI38_9STRA|nr:hypothetical protein JKP88DRAFT_276232 [Tribonema minus]